MAMMKSIILDNGLIADNAYIRIDTVNGYKGNIQISVNSYINQQAFQNGIGYLQQKLYNFIPNVEDSAPNFIKQGYEYLKTLPEYENVIDC